MSGLVASIHFGATLGRPTVRGFDAAGRDLGHIEYQDDLAGLIFIEEIFVLAQRRGVGTMLLDALRARYPRRDFLVTDRESNSDAGNDFIDAYNRRAGRTVVEFVGD